ncbi:hypothetical protein C4B63_25g300 [Trypanosoma cruzi]|uniref:Exocyst complex component n=1 Tax=Trypanosoma cruzi TaxID=5693 RepID=A0A2V2VEE2_TRYCR|nr:hypothetical protein C4B63_25g300 [Trypanosoma cruzi]
MDWGVLPISIHWYTSVCVFLSVCLSVCVGVGSLVLLLLLYCYCGCCCLFGGAGKEHDDGRALFFYYFLFFISCFFFFFCSCKAEETKKKGGFMAGRAPDTEAALQLDPTSRTFDPKAYIRQAHVHATHVDIENTLLQTVGREVDFTEEALKELIRDNIGTFIGCKEAMDVMYANDTLLFTGEAIDPIADAFQTTLEAGEALVAPTVELFEELRSCRLTKEMLEKLMVVWNVPGVIYEYCGARVPQRRSDVQPSQRGLIDGRKSQTRGRVRMVVMPTAAAAV